MTGTAPSFQTLTTMGVGGDPAGYIEVADTDELVEVARTVWAGNDLWFVLGGGSNVVVADDGFDGVVIAPRNEVIEVISHDDAHTVIRAGAGVVWDDLVGFAIGEGWGGIETLSGIPGRAGAAPIQNIGAYGHELAEAIVELDFLDATTRTRHTITAAECDFGYRSSIFKHGRDGIVLSVMLSLRSDGLSLPIGYEQLARVLGAQPGARLPVAEVRAAILSLRASKGMVLDPADPDTAGCGSFFVNPIVSAEVARRLPPSAPRWPVGDQPIVSEATIIPLTELGSTPIPPAPPVIDSVKLSAAWLIEHAGIHKGFALPGSRAGISTKHTLALTNRGGATAAEIVELARYVQVRVAAEFGVVLQPEPRLIGLAL